MNIAKYDRSTSIQSRHLFKNRSEIQWSAHFDSRIPVLTFRQVEPEKKDNRVKPVDDQKLRLSVLAAMVVRSVVGAGIQCLRRKKSSFGTRRAGTARCIPSIATAALFM